MLSAAFFFSVFTSFVWIFYAFSNLNNGDLNHFSLMIMIIVLPIFILWSVFGYIYQYNSTSVLNKNMYTLFRQMKKNHELSDATARILLEARGTLLDNIILSKFDVFIADMNELLADIIKRSQLIPAEQVDNLWIKVKNGGKWAFGKVIIDVAQSQPTLPNKLLQKALTDTVLSGTILEFCSRYQSLINALEKHDQACLFLNIIETGVFGKVFSLLAMPADSIRQNRDLSLAHEQMAPSESDDRDAEDSFALPESFAPEYNLSQDNKEGAEKESSSSKISENARRLFVNTFRKKEPRLSDESLEDTESNDPLSVAFAKSFGPSSNEDKRQPRLTERQEILSDTRENREESYPTFEDSSSMPEINLTKETSLSEETSAITPELTAGFQNTQEKLASLKKEWEEAKQRDLRVVPTSAEEEGMPEPKISNDSDFSYPFGGWANENNYDK